MRLCAGLASTKLALLPRSSTTRWTADSEYLLWIPFFPHGRTIMLHDDRTRMVTFEQCAVRITLKTPDRVFRPRQGR
jgi:hypothetical protein